MSFVTLDPYQIVITQLPWVIQVILIRISATKNLFRKIIRDNREYCVNYTNRETRIDDGGQDCTTLYAPWATFFGIAISTLCTLLINSNIALNKWISLIGLLLTLSICRFLLNEINKGEVWRVNDLNGYALLATLLNASYTLLVSLAPA